jgi:hypothetical protein
MRFAVPQFIEHEAKIFGPFTFGQFIYIGVAGGACFILFFILPTPLFIAASVILLGGALSLIFLRINGRPIPLILGSFIKFIFTPKMYIWKKKETMITAIKKQPMKKKEREDEEELPLKIAGDSQLKKLRTHIETKTR